jgi:hypothetical protein
MFWSLRRRQATVTGIRVVLPAAPLFACFEDTGQSRDEASASLFSARLLSGPHQRSRARAAASYAKDIALRFRQSPEVLAQIKDLARAISMRTAMTVSGGN